MQIPAPISPHHEPFRDQSGKLSIAIEKNTRE